MQAPRDPSLPAARDRSLQAPRDPLQSTSDLAIAPLHHGECQVWWADPDACDARLLEHLDDDERRRHAAFLREEDRARFLVAHALARIVAAAQLPTAPRLIAYAGRPPVRGGAPGKPRFAGAAADLQLSISHAGQRVVVALSRAVPIGVDVERCDGPPVERTLVESVLDPAEQRELDALAAAARTSGFYRYWTRKEAVLKATGDGLSVAPTRIVVTGPQRPPALTGWTGGGRPTLGVHLHDLDPGSGYVAALASIGAPLAPTQHDAAGLLEAWS